MVQLPEQRGRSPLRRLRARTPALLLIAVLAAVTLGGCARSAPRSLIVICVDTLRVDHVGAYGYRRATTPRLDALAGQGVRFDRAISTSNWTVPAVASVFTAVLPSRHGAGVPGDPKNLDIVPPAGMAPELKSLADVLKAEGFRTGLFSANPFLYGPFKRSFDEALVKLVPADELADAAIAWLQRAPEERTFVYVQFMDTHQPNLPPDSYFNMFGTPGAGPREKRHSDWSYGAVENPNAPDFRSFRANRIAVYDGSIRYVDDQIRRFLDRLEEMGVLRDSLVVAYSDHGEELWDHVAEQRELHDDPRKIWGIGHGHTMYQELLQVPLIFWRDERPRKPVIDCPTSLIDIAPTALEILEIAPPETMVGTSLAGLIEGTQTCVRRAIVAESPGYGPDSTAVLLWPMKLVRRGLTTSVFDLSRDRFERRDLSSSAPGVRDELLAVLDRYERSRNERGPALEVDAETLEQLRALGYLAN